MFSRVRRSLALALGALTLTVVACMSTGSKWVELKADTAATGTPLRISGVIRHNEIEGGFWAIRGDDSVTYDPTNLPEEFKRDGLRVEAEANRRDDMAGIHMSGPLVELRRIRKLP
jgi:hypothetical protein